MKIARSPEQYLDQLKVARDRLADLVTALEEKLTEYVNTSYDDLKEKTVVEFINACDELQTAKQQFALAARLVQSPDAMSPENYQEARNIFGEMYDSRLAFVELVQASRSAVPDKLVFNTFQENLTSPIDSALRRLVPRVSDFELLLSNNA